jgi:hypothetical protein
MPYYRIALIGRASKGIANPTPDIGGAATTRAASDAVIKAC